MVLGTEQPRPCSENLLLELAGRGKNQALAPVLWVETQAVSLNIILKPFNLAEN